MKIVNIDASEHLAGKVVNLRIPEFVIKVVRPLEQDFYNHFSHHQIICGIHSHNKNTPLPLSPIWKFESGGMKT